MFNNLDHIKISSYLAYCLVPAIVTGPFLSDLILSLIAIYFLFVLIFTKPYEIIPKEFTYIFFLSFFYIIIRSSLSDFSFNSLTYDGVIFYFRYYFFCLGILYLSINNKNLIKNIIFISLITSLVVIADGSLQLLTGKNILGWEILYRVSGLFKDELVIGIFLSKIILMVFAYYDLTYNNKYQKVRYFYLLLGLIFLIYTRERAALILFIIYFLFYFTFVKKIDLKKNFLIIFLTIFAITLVFIFSKYISNYFLITITQINQGYIPFIPYPEGYEGLLLSALNIFNENNIYFGSGANSFRNLCEEYAFKNFCTSHPHHYYVQNLIDLGLLGLALMIMIYLRCFIYFFTINSKNILLRGFVLIGLIHFFPFIPSMNFYNNWTNVMVYIPIAISLCYWNKTEKS